MKYILDFDEVIFHTAALKQKMQELHIFESERGPDVLLRIQEADPSFSLEALLFPDARAFLEVHGRDCFIISSASSTVVENNTDVELQKAFQWEKIRQSGVEQYIDKTRIHIVAEEKREVLEKLRRQLMEQGELFVFVDDRERYIREAQELGIPTVWMCRQQPFFHATPEHMPATPEFVRISSFAELETVVHTWEEEKK